jgi:SAM-dependent methyltransferase
VSGLSRVGLIRLMRGRVRVAEWMDEPDVDPVELADSLTFIRRVNTFLRYTRATLSYLERFSRSWKTGETIRIVDFATGSADVPLAIVDWARRRGFDVRVVGIDLHEATCRTAREATRHEPNIQILRADALDPPFGPGSFDYATTSMFLHHLADEQAVRVLEVMGHVARRGIIAADLLRHPRAYIAIRLLTIGANAMVRHDACVSVAQAFTLKEMRVLAERAGVGFAKLHRHFGYRFVLAGEKMGSGAEELGPGAKAPGFAGGCRKLFSHSERI